ncbi:MAG: thioredoxin family protein [Fimbriimonas sp.]
MTFLPLIACAATLTVPPTADEVLRQAQTQAAREGKNVFVKFEASWCPWCRRLNALLASDRFGPAFRASYVVAPITVREREEKRALENPGWERTFRRLRGAPEKDVPYVVVLSPKGEKLVDSYRPADGEIPGNAGYPRTAEEIDAFLDLIRRTGREFSAEDRLALRDFLRLGPPSH